MDTILTNKYNLEVLNKRISNFAFGYRQNITVLYPEREYTELFKEYLISISTKINLPVVYLSFLYADKTIVLKNVIFSILNSLNNKKILSLDDLIREREPKLPHTVALIKDMLRLERAVSLKDILNIINSFCEEAQTKCIVVIEEFTNISRVFNNYLEDIINFIMFKTNCLVIMISSDLNKAENLLSTDFNLLFGNFEKIYWGGLTYYEGYLYLKNIFKELSIECKDNITIPFLVNLLETNPLYYINITNHLRDTLNMKEEDIYKNILVSSLLDENSYFYQKFISRVDNFYKKFKNFHLISRIIMSISDGYIRKNEILSLNLDAHNIVNQRLTDLCEEEVIEKNGSLYRIKDTLFTFWLKYQYFPTYVYPGLSRKDKLEYFLTNVDKFLSSFKIEYSKDIVNRTFELANSFKNDYLYINDAKVNLPSVRYAKTMYDMDYNMHYIVGEGNKILFIGIKNALVEDDDIVHFLEKTSLIKNKHIKNIFIAPNRISRIAKVIAKEHKLVVYESEDLNYLFRIYNRPIFINYYENNSNF